MIQYHAKLWTIQIIHISMVTLISAIVTKSSATMPISTIYPHLQLHLHTLEIAHHIRLRPPVQKSHQCNIPMIRNECVQFLVKFGPVNFSFLFASDSNKIVLKWLKFKVFISSVLCCPPDSIYSKNDQDMIPFEFLLMRFRPNKIQQCNTEYFTNTSGIEST